MSDLIGKTLQGKYHVTALLGKGGMAEVFKAQHITLERDVAIKVLHRGSEDPAFIDRFKREASVIARLHHPNILQVHDFDIADGLAFMVIEYLEGTTLKDKLKETHAQGSRLPLKDIGRLFTQIAGAVEYAHSRGVIHRDLKPANILFNAEGQAMLTDFGISLVANSTRATLTEAIVGTPAYMSPEQGQSERGDTRSDIYSLGVMLYEMTTGKLPFDADTPMAVIVQHITEPLPLPRTINPNLSQDVESVLIKALEKKADDRYQTAREMMESLRHALEMTDELPSPLKKLEHIPNNLPSQVTSFIGRGKEMIEIKHVLETSRLITLTGTGGTGKTRLSLQVAHDVLEKFPQGVWFVELAPITDPVLILSTLMAMFRLQENADDKRTPTERLVTYFHEKTSLLILDNCEHLIDACARLANAFLISCPDFRIIATSREALGVAGEVSYRVPSLSIPDARHPPLLEALKEIESVRLFSERATSSLQTFAITNQNAQYVAQICQRLDGIPLAIELAASRVKGMNVEEIVKRLDDRFRLLKGGSRSALPRQQTLEAMVDWSHSLLTASEKILLRRLSVFAGGWTLEAAEAVCAGEGLESFEVLDVLLKLVDKSLVWADDTRDGTRYRLLETIRKYANNKLLDTDEVESIRNHHLDYFLKFAEEVEPKLRGSEQMEWLDRLELEHDNLRAALDWSLGEGRVEKGLRLATALMWFWDMRAYWSEGRERAVMLLNQPEAAAKTLTRANALLVATYQGRWLYAAKMNNEYLEELVSIAREYGVAGKRMLALGLGFWGSSIFGDDPVAAESMLEEGLSITRSLGDEWLIGILLNLRGQLFLGRKDHRAARKALEESLMRFKSSGDQHWATTVSFQISRVHYREGEYALTRQELEKLLPFFRQAKDRSQVFSAVNLLGIIAHAEGTYDLAKRYYAEALEIARELGGKFGIAIAAGNLGYIMVHDGDLNSARSLFIESLALARELDQKPSLAFALIGSASIAAAEKQARRAVQLFAVADTLLEAGDKRIVTSVDEAEYNHNLAIAREQLDEAAFNAAWAEGKAMTVEQAIEYALETAQ